MRSRLLLANAWMLCPSWMQAMDIVHPWTLDESGAPLLPITTFSIAMIHRLVVSLSLTWECWPLTWTITLSDVECQSL